MEMLSALLAFFEENLPVTGGAPYQKANDVEHSQFLADLKNMLNEQWSCQWFQGGGGGNA